MLTARHNFHPRSVTQSLSKTSRREERTFACTSFHFLDCDNCMMNGFNLPPHEKNKKSGVLLLGYRVIFTSYQYYFRVHLVYCAHYILLYAKLHTFSGTRTRCHRQEVQQQIFFQTNLETLRSSPYVRHSELISLLLYEHHNTKTTTILRLPLRS